VEPTEVSDACWFAGHCIWIAFHLRFVCACVVLALRVKGPMVRFATDIVVTEYELSDEERMQKFVASRRRKRNRKRGVTPPCSEILVGSRGDMDGRELECISSSDVPATPVLIQYASSSPRSRAAMKFNSEVAKNCERENEAMSSELPLLQQEVQMVLRKDNKITKEKKNQSKLNAHARRLQIQKAKALDGTYWELLLSTLIFIKMMTHIFLNIVRENGADSKKPKLMYN